MDERKPWNYAMVVDRERSDESPRTIDVLRVFEYGKACISIVHIGGNLLKGGLDHLFPYSADP
jgi:hypothetical protein